MKIKEFKRVLKKMGYTIRNLRDYHSASVKRYFINQYIVFKNGEFVFIFWVEKKRLKGWCDYDILSDWNAKEVEYKRNKVKVA